MNQIVGSCRKFVHWRPSRPSVSGRYLSTSNGCKIYNGEFTLYDGKVNAKKNQAWAERIKQLERERVLDDRTEAEQWKDYIRESATPLNGCLALSVIFMGTIWYSAKQHYRRRWKSRRDAEANSNDIKNVDGIERLSTKNQNVEFEETDDFDPQAWEHIENYGYTFKGWLKFLWYANPFRTQDWMSKLTWHEQINITSWDWYLWKKMVIDPFSHWSMPEQKRQMGIHPEQYAFADGNFKYKDCCPHCYRLSLLSVLILWVLTTRRRPGLRIMLTISLLWLMYAQARQISLKMMWHTYFPHLKEEPFEMREPGFNNITYYIPLMNERRSFWATYFSSRVGDTSIFYEDPQLRNTCTARKAEYMFSMDEIDQHVRDVLSGKQQFDYFTRNNPRKLRKIMAEYTQWQFNQPFPEDIILKYLDFADISDDKRNVILNSQRALARAKEASEASDEAVQKQTGNLDMTYLESIK